METIFARHELHHVSLQGFSFMIHRTCSSFMYYVSKTVTHYLFWTQKHARRSGKSMS